MMRLNVPNLGALAGAARRPVGWCAAALLLAGCVLGSPDLETSREYSGATPAGLYQRTLETLRASDLEVTGTDDGVITATGRFENRGWATCQRSLRIVRDSENRASTVRAPEDHREVELEASVSDTPRGAALTLDPAFSVEPESEFAAAGECRTTGTLER
ncbi:MAG: hypothetical protein ACREJ5_13935 [Geminicoccaceae bacterium]